MKKEIMFRNIIIRRNYQIEIQIERLINENETNLYIILYVFMYKLLYTLFI